MRVHILFVYVVLYLFELSQELHAESRYGYAMK